jgi:membrane-bound metal-dependent hydrolase YbcI (DUF457 family)
VPATPFHLPPSTVVAWPLRRHLDLPSFLLANLAIDIEPGIALLFDLGPPPHGFAHTLVGGTLVGATTGWLLWRAKGSLESLWGEDYPLRARVAMGSGAAGCWLHVLLDSVMYGYLRPFFPLATNPFYVPASGDALHLVSALMVVPAFALTIRARCWQTIPEKLTFGLLGLATVTMGLYAVLGMI